VYSKSKPPDYAWHCNTSISLAFTGTMTQDFCLLKQSVPISHLLSAHPRIPNSSSAAYYAPSFAGSQPSIPHLVYDNLFLIWNLHKCSFPPPNPQCFSPAGYTSCVSCAPPLPPHRFLNYKVQPMFFICNLQYGSAR
jgi:hypothetical protein